MQLIIIGSFKMLKHEPHLEILTRVFRPRSFEMHQDTYTLSALTDDLSTLYEALIDYRYTRSDHSSSQILQI